VLLLLRLDTVAVVPRPGRFRGDGDRAGLRLRKRDSSSSSRRETSVCLSAQ
jgi:hypothetical protein